jgi:hypothetical protein
VVEVTDGDVMLEKMRWSLIYHEHLSYFRDVGLTLLAARAGLRVEAIERVPVHGGSLRAWLSRRSSDAEQLRADVRRQIDALRASLRQRPRRVVGFGCPAKAALLIAELGVPFAYLADDTPAKIGKFCPGTNIEIRPLSALAAEPEAVTVVLLAWNQPRDFAAWMQRHRAGMGDAVVMV